MGKNYSSNDMRSMAMNSNSSHYQAAMENHSNQMNSNNDAYWSSRGGNDYYGLDDYYGGFSADDFTKEVKPIAEKVVNRFKDYESNIIEIKTLNSRTNRYKELKGLIINFNLSGKQIEVVLEFEEFNDISMRMLEYAFSDNKGFEFIFKLSRYSHLNDFTFNVWIKYMLDQLDNNQNKFRITEHLLSKGLDKVKESYIKKIEELYKDKSISVKYDAAILHSSALTSVVFRFIRSCIFNDNLKLAKRIQEYFKLNEELFNGLEYKKDEINIKKNRSLYNSIPDNDEWIKFLVSIGAKASTNENTLLFRRLNLK